MDVTETKRVFYRWNGTERRYEIRRTRTESLVDTFDVSGVRPYSSCVREALRLNGVAMAEGAEA